MSLAREKRSVSSQIDLCNVHHLQNWRYASEGILNVIRLFALFTYSQILHIMCVPWLKTTLNNLVSSESVHNLIQIMTVCVKSQAIQRLLSSGGLAVGGGQGARVDLEVSMLHTCSSCRGWLGVECCSRRRGWVVRIFLVLSLVLS